jgi:hypothetical protein
VPFPAVGYTFVAQADRDCRNRSWVRRCFRVWGCYGAVCYCWCIGNSQRDNTARRRREARQPGA